MNYGELKESAIAMAYNRRDLEPVIPHYLELAERLIFRVLRVPGNEHVLNGTTSDGVIPVPEDFVEAKLLMVGGVALERISDVDYTARRQSSMAAGRPKQFARIGDNFYLYPPPDGERATSLIYYRDLSGQLQADSDTNNILRIAPDLYINGLMVYLMAYLVHDERVQLFKQQFSMGLEQINQQAVEAEYAGSPVHVANPYGSA